jgi:hypothetical protein
MLNVFQLMTALPLDWLMMTDEVPWPLMVAAPPTTVPPAGPAATGGAASNRPSAVPSAKSGAMSAVVVSKRLRERGCIAGPPRAGR